MFFPSDLNIFGILFYSIFGIFAVLLGFLDYFELLAMRYSKFRSEKGVPSRLGLFILYFLPVITATIFALPYLGSASLAQWLVYTAVMIHFLKRTYEVLFVHKYSGPIQPFTFVIIVVTYALIAGLTSALNAQAIPAVDALFTIGIVLFIIGQIGNFYHHKLLPICAKRKAATTSRAADGLKKLVARITSLNCWPGWVFCCSPATCSPCWLSSPCSAT